MPSSNALQTRLATEIARRIYSASPREPLPLDVREFQRRCVFTNDDHWKSKGLSSPVQPWPDKEYLKLLTDEWLKEKLLWIDKSRDLIVTWWAVSCLLHAGLTTPGIWIGYQSKDFEDANNFLESRFMLMYDLIPFDFEKPLAYLNKAKGVLVIKHKGKPSTRIMAIAEGGDKARQYKFAYFFSDEEEFQRWAEKTATALRPTLDAGGCWLRVSSANGKGNLHYQVGYGDVS